MKAWVVVIDTSPGNRYFKISESTAHFECQAKSVTTHVTLINTKIWLRRIYNSYKSPINFFTIVFLLSNKREFFLILVYQLCLVSIPRRQKQQGRWKGLNHGHFRVSQSFPPSLLVANYWTNHNSHGKAQPGAPLRCQCSNYGWFVVLYQIVGYLII